MPNVEKLKRERKEELDRMAAMIAVAETREDAVFTEAETAEYDGYNARVSALDAQIKRAEELLAREAAVAATADATVTKDEADNKPEFRCLGELVSAYIGHRNGKLDGRIEKRLTTMGNTDQAGALVVPEWDTTIRKIDPGNAIVRSHATVISGSESSADANFNMISFDQSGANGVYGGVISNWFAEGGDRSSAMSDYKIKTTEFTPFINASMMHVTQQLLNNYAALDSLIQASFSDAITNTEEKAFLLGTGVGQPTGFLSHPCNVAVTRTAALAISYDDIVQMISRYIGTGGIFIASKAAMPSLLALKDTAGNLIWQPNARDGSPGTLMGYPVYFTDRSPSLGTRGDLCLCDLTKYYIRDGSALSLFTDPYTLAHTGVVRLFARINVDAKPLLTTPIKGEDAVDRSPFVTLATKLT